jgi:hypothetical protein
LKEWCVDETAPLADTFVVVALERSPDVFRPFDAGLAFPSDDVGRSEGLNPGLEVSAVSTIMRIVTVTPYTLLEDWLPPFVESSSVCSVEDFAERNLGRRVVGV